MVFSGLKKLKDVENRLYLVLILWIIIGFTVYRFLPPEAAVFIFLPLIGICVVLFLVSIISRKKVNEFSKKRMLVHFILAIPFVVLLFYIAVYLFYVALLSYVLITAVFTIYNCYKIGTDIHDKFSKLRSPINNIFQWVLFVIGVVLSIGIIFGTNYVLENILNYVIDATTFNPYGLAWILTIVIIFFTVIALILAIRGTLNSWLGMFFIGVAAYVAYLQYSVVSATQPEAGGSYSLAIEVALYFCNLFLLLWTIDSLLGTRSEIITQKLRVFGSDTVLIWLILSTAAYEFAEGSPEAEVGLFKNIVVFILFIPLLLIMGLYGLNYYRIKKKEFGKVNESENPA